MRATVLKPQAGPQEQFLASRADIAIYGGAAGGGKSYALLLEPLRHVHDPAFRAVIFRRTSKQIRNEGGLWDAARQLYDPLGVTAKETDLVMRFPSGATISFGAMEHDKNRYDWQGTEITYLGFDELTHFTARQFYYLLSRNRSTSGIPPYVRATCNPDADSWVADLVNWWIDRESGYADPARSGTVRHFTREGDQLAFCDEAGAGRKSLTFIAANIDDNQILLAKDPSYKATLGALDRVERERLLNGNWKIRPEGGQYFKAHWFAPIEAGQVPPMTRKVRGWDLAATVGGGDWSASALVGRDESGRFYILDVARFQGSPADVEQGLRDTAKRDGRDVAIILPQDPGQAGKAQAQSLSRLLAGYRVRSKPVTGAKILRASPFSAQVEAGNVFLVKGPWNEAFVQELQNFPTGRHDDQVDAAVDAFTALTDPSHKSQRDMYG